MDQTPNVIPAGQSPATPVSVKKHSPILCALSHILIFGAVYLHLRLYKRFFAAVGIMAVASFIPMRAVGYLVLLAAMVDTYQQVQGINDGKIQKEPFDQKKHVGGCLLLIAIIVLSFVARASFLAWR